MLYELLFFITHQSIVLIINISINLKQIKIRKLSETESKFHFLIQKYL